MTARRRGYWLRLGGFTLALNLLGAAIAVGAFSMQAARAVVFPARVVDQRTPADVGLPYEPVAFPSTDGVPLRGWFVPGGPGAVVVAHGHASNKGAMLDYARFLWEQGGYSVLLFDFRAMGESDGALCTLGYYEGQDVAGALAWLRTRPGIDATRIGALGVSMGAATLLMMGDGLHQFRAVVADSAFGDGESLVGRLDRWFRLPRWPFSWTVPLAVQALAGLAPRDVAPLRRVAAVAPTPLLIIHGADDAGIPAEDARLLHAAAGEPKELWIAPEAQHAAAYTTAPQQYVDRVLTFLRRHLD